MFVKIFSLILCMGLTSVAVAYDESGDLSTLPSGTQLVFKSNLDIPANTTRLRFTDLGQDLNCDLVYPESLAGRQIPAGTAITVENISESQWLHLLTLKEWSDQDVSIHCIGPNSTTIADFMTSVEGVLDVILPEQPEPFPSNWR